MLLRAGQSENTVQGFNEIWCHRPLFINYRQWLHAAMPGAAIVKMQKSNTSSCSYVASAKTAVILFVQPLVLAEACCKAPGNPQGRGGEENGAEHREQEQLYGGVAKEASR